MTTGRENTIGLVDRGAMFGGADGELITLVIPALFQAHHMPFLNGVLALRLEDVFGEDQVSFGLEAGELERWSRGSSYEAGRIIIVGISEPWPNGEMLRAALDEAFEQPGAVDAEQLSRADELVEHLLTTGDRVSDHPPV
jgi:hypothetical protein